MVRVLSFALLTIVTLDLPLSALAESSSEESVGPALQQTMIWLPDLPVEQEVYAVFRKEFALEALPERAVLELFADSRYLLWINGRYVERGPCRFDPKGPEYDSLDVRTFLQKGPNAVAVLVHHFHDGRQADEPGDFSGRIMRHAPGLTARLELSEAGGLRVLTTDPTWRGSWQTRYLPSGPAWSSIPDRIDARRDRGDWTAAGFDDSPWAQAIAVDGTQWGPLRARRIPRLRESEVGPLLILGDPSVPLEQRLPLELAAGAELVLDAGRFFQAYTVLDFEADAGTELELEYPPTWYANGGKPSGGYGANRYTARAGRQSYLSGDTFGGKYVILRVRSGRMRLERLRLVNRLYPFDVAGRFQSSDAKLNAIWQIGVDTVRLCSEDAYVDCATRERVEWLADAVMVADPVARVTLCVPCDPPVYGDTRSFENLLRHTGLSAQPDGRVKAHHPSNRWDIHGFIEDYACLWIQGLRSYTERTGELELAGELWPAVTAQLQWFFDRRTERGLVRGREFLYAGNPLAYKVCEGATLNACLVAALRDAAELARRLERPAEAARYAKAATTITAALNEQLWDDAVGAYHGGILEGKLTAPTVHAAMLCLYYDLVPAERRQRLERWTVEHLAQEKPLPYQYAFFFEVLYRMDCEEADRLVLELMRRRWGPMIDFETKTTWEGFGRGGEPCHEAGSVPTLFLSNAVLGVRVDGPLAAKRLRIQPRLGDLESAEGIVATEFGPVAVAWRCRPEGLSLELEIPAGVTASVGVPRRFDGGQLRVDGQAVVTAGAGRFAPVELGPGKHRGEWTVN